MRVSCLVILMTAMSACSAPGGPYPSLQPRAAEQVDPRVPVERPLNQRPVSPALASRLAQLVSQATSGDAAFQNSIIRARQLADAAGAAQSESWIAAQEALTAAIAARGPTATALGDIDEIGGNALQSNGGLSPNDLTAVQRAGAEVGAIDQRQADAVKAIQRRLGL